MKVNEFKKTIKFEELAKCSDADKFMFKSYLNILLNGGKKFEECYLYSVGSFHPAFNNSVDAPLSSYERLLDEREKDIISLFKKMVKEGQWVVEDEKEEFYDENGKITWDNYFDSGTIISKKVETKTKTTYYMNKPVKIKPLKRCKNETIF